MEQINYSKLLKLENKNQTPITRFIDQQEAIEVKLVNFPDPMRSEQTMVDFIFASWRSEGNKYISDWREIIIQSLKGNTLNLALETLSFTFLVKNIGLHITHCIVRHRIGVTFSQRSTVTSDIRNDDILVPRSFTKDPEMYSAYKRWVLQGKMLYADMIDMGIAPSQDARLCIPKNNSNYIYMHCSLLALINFISKRSCMNEEPIELNIIARKMRDLVVEKFSYFKTIFKSICDQNRCLHQRPGFFANCVYKRDIDHVVKEENITLHDSTRNEMIDGKPVKLEIYRGFERRNK